jgi:hypothetical protein
METKCGESTTQSCLFPLYLYPDREALVGAYPPYGGRPHDEQGRRPNLSPDFVKAFSEKVGLQFIPDGKGDLEKTGCGERSRTIGPEDVFHYAYAVFHSPTYRARYAQFLRIDFPRLPLTSDPALFKALAEKGEELVSLHLMESPKLDNFITRFPVSGSNQVDKVRYEERRPQSRPPGLPASVTLREAKGLAVPEGAGETARFFAPLRMTSSAAPRGRVYINKDQYFEGIAPEVWNFQVGGYQVLNKWLKDRKGRELSYEDIAHYQRIVVALNETIRLMAEIDELVPSWPIE